MYMHFDVIKGGNELKYTATHFTSEYSELC